MEEGLLTIGKWCFYIMILVGIVGVIYNLIIHPFIKKKPYLEWKAKRKELQDHLRYFNIEYRVESIADIDLDKLKVRYTHKKEIEGLKGNKDLVEEKYQKILNLRNEERTALYVYEQ